MEANRALAALAALSQETRLAIFRLLVEAGPTGLSVGEIAASVKSAPATLSFHLKELAHADLVGGRQDGRYIFYSANYPQMNALIAFLTENCCARDRGMPSNCATSTCAPSKSAVESTAQSTKRRGSRGAVKTR